MIAKLVGTLDSVGEDWAIVLCGGVGYLVFCSGKTLARLPGPGEAVSLVVETHVREDHIHLYGFAAEAERSWFKLLQGVQGVGARVALAILTVLAPDQLGGAILAQDKKAIGQATGVGPKLAARICSELKDKVGGLAPAMPVPVGAVPIPADAAAGPVADAVSALTNLGYGRAEAMGAVDRAAKTLGAEAEASALIRAGLREMGAA